MIAPNPRRQSLRNRAKHQHNLLVQPSPMDIENHPHFEDLRKPIPLTERPFGKDITNGVLHPQSLPKGLTVTLQNTNPPTLHPTLSTHFQMCEEPPLTIRKSEVSIYEDSIASFLESIEKKNHPAAGFLGWQTEITENMREILICWIVELHDRFRLREETLFKTINIIDKFLSLEFVSKPKLQLLGVSAMFIACKYEEIHLQDVRKFVSVCGNTYTVQELLEMESKILVLMNFDMNTTSPLSLVELKCQMLTLGEDICLFSEYLLELCLVEYKMCQYQPTLMSLASMYLSGKILNNKAITSSLLLKQFHIDEGCFKSCLKDMFQIYKCKDSHKHQVIKRKYSRRGIE